MVLQCKKNDIINNLFLLHIVWEMNKETLPFGDIGTDKHKFHYLKNSI